MRREFALPAEDQRHLDQLGLPWEAVKNAGEFWVLLHSWPMPAGYDRSTTSVGIKIESGYPIAQLDMAYFWPPLRRADGRAIPCSDATHQRDGNTWQRWSRHRTPLNPWLAGEDSLETHLILVRDWLPREFERTQ